MYWRRTPGVQVLAHGSTALDDWGEPQPDAQLRILPECGGQTRDDERYVVGAPELVAEVARSSRDVDLGPKRDDYERAGVLEYIVRAADPDEVIWHERRDGKLVVVSPDADGLYRSNAFPGLWLDPRALLADDLDGLLAALDRGLSSSEHAEFVARLANAKQTSSVVPPSFEGMIAPIAEDFRQSSMTGEELDALVEQERQALWDEKHS
jgi:hypothetical protein